MSAFFKKIFHAFLHVLLHTADPIKPYAKENNKLRGTIYCILAIVIVALYKPSGAVIIAIIGIATIGILFLVCYMIQKSKKRSS